MLYLGYEGVRSGVRGYYIRGMRVLDPRYEGIRSGGTKVLNLWCEGVRYGVRGC